MAPHRLPYADVGGATLGTTSEERAHGDPEDLGLHRLKLPPRGLQTHRMEVPLRDRRG